MTQIDFFYREFGTDRFIHENAAIGKEIVRVVPKSKYAAADMFFSSREKRWKNLSEFQGPGEKNDSAIFFEYAERPACIPALDMRHRDKDAKYIEDYTAAEMELYLEYRAEEARSRFAESNALDGNKIPKNIFAYEISTDTDSLAVGIKAREFVPVEKPVETQTCDETEKIAEIRYDIRNGKIFETIEKFDIPEEIASFALGKLLEVASLFTGKNITAQKGSSSEKTLLMMDYITSIPFEPNLFTVVNDEYAAPLKFKIDRTNSRIFGDFCRKAGIKNHRMLRKSYIERPASLLTYMRVKSCGFKDVNIFNRVLSERNLYTLFDENCRRTNDQNLVFFCKKCIKARGETCTLNLLSKTGTGISGAHPDFAFSDGIAMFRAYFKKIPQFLRDEIYREGFTPTIHDALSEISYKCENENKKFTYTKEQRSLEDDIDGFSFRLPTDSYKLCDIGMKMHNCVALYTDSVLYGKCTIVYAEKKGEYRICIEICGTEAKQELAPRNREPGDEEKNALKKWHERHGIKE